MKSQKQTEALQPADVLSEPPFRYFAHCIGAVDGTHVPFRPRKPPELDSQTPYDPQLWCNRKGYYSQNVLIACDFDLNILFVQAGYQGSGNNNAVLDKAMRNGFTVPNGRFYLADGGYSKKNTTLLVPYQRTRYHLREHQSAQRRPETPQELYNLRHSVLRNCVERVIGIQKGRWRILQDGPGTGVSSDNQCRIIYALTAVHNFIKENGQSVEEDEQSLPKYPRSDRDVDDHNIDGAVHPSSDEMTGYRDQLTRAMWDNR